MTSWHSNIRLYWSLHKEFSKISPKSVGHLRASYLEQQVAKPHLFFAFMLLLPFLMAECLGCLTPPSPVVQALVSICPAFRPTPQPYRPAELSCLVIAVQATCLDVLNSKGLVHPSTTFATLKGRLVFVKGRGFYWSILWRAKSPRLVRRHPGLPCSTCQL